MIQLYCINMCWGSKPYFSKKINKTQYRIFNELIRIILHIKFRLVDSFNNLYIMILKNSPIDGRVGKNLT